MGLKGRVEIAESVLSSPMKRESKATNWPCDVIRMPPPAHSEENGEHGEEGTVKSTGEAHPA